MTFQDFIDRVSTALGAIVIVLITWILLLFATAILARFGGIFVLLICAGIGIFLSTKIIIFARATSSDDLNVQENSGSALFKDEKNRNAMGFLLACIILVAIFRGIFSSYDEISFIILFFIAIIGYLVWFCFRAKNLSRSLLRKDEIKA